MFKLNASFTSKVGSGKDYNKWTSAGNSGISFLIGLVFGMFLDWIYSAFVRCRI